MVESDRSPEDSRTNWKKELLYCGVCAGVVSAAAAVYHVVSKNWDAINKAHEANVKSIDEKGAWGSFRETYLGEDVPDRTEKKEK